MIRRLIGIAATAAVIAAIVFAVLGRGSYRSMIFDDLPESSAPAMGKAPHGRASDAPSASAESRADSAAVSAPDTL